MPLLKGKANIGKNIKEMEKSKTFAKGKPKAKKKEMARAAALKKAAPQTWDEATASARKRIEEAEE